MTAASSEPKRRRLPGWCVGAFIGMCVWGVVLVVGLTSDTIEPFVPKWTRNFDLVDSIGTICMFLSAPLAIGGLLFSTSRPNSWLLNWPVNIAVALFMWAIVGAAVGQTISKWKRGRERDDYRSID